jgi:hypothetical protein
MADEQTDTQPQPNLSTDPGEKGPAPNSMTETQKRPNLSIEHQEEGDARSPSETLDRGQDGRVESPDKTSLTKNA